MHLKSLKIFCDVASRRSFSRAAAMNGLTQSGASQVVLQLEKRLGVQLIDRSKRPFVLTSEGETYYEGCRAIVQRYFALEEEVRLLRQEVAGRVRVASIYSVGLSHMNDFIQHFMGLYPKANIRLDYEHPARVYELVEDDQIDLGLVSFPKGSRDIVALSWREEPMVFVCSPQHDLARPGPIPLDDLRGVKMIAFDAGLKIRRVIDNALARHGVETEVVMAFDNIETLKRAIEINAGVSILPEPTVAREVQLGSLVVRPLANETLVRPIGIVYRRGKELGATAHRFMQLLREYSPSSPPVSSLSSSPPSSSSSPPAATLPHASSPDPRDRSDSREGEEPVMPREERSDGVSDRRADRGGKKGRQAGAKRGKRRSARTVPDAP